MPSILPKSNVAEKSSSARAAAAKRRTRGVQSKGEAEFDDAGAGNDCADIEAQGQLRMLRQDRRDPRGIQEFFHRRPHQRKSNRPPQAIKPEGAEPGIPRYGQCEIGGEPKKERIVQHVKQTIAGSPVTV